MYIVHQQFIELFIRNVYYGAGEREWEHSIEARKYNLIVHDHLERRMLSAMIEF